MFKNVWKRSFSILLVLAMVIGGIFSINKTNADDKDSSFKVNVFHEYDLGDNENGGVVSVTLEDEFGSYLDIDKVMADDEILPVMKSGRSGAIFNVPAGKKKLTIQGIAGLKGNDGRVYVALHNFGKGIQKIDLRKSTVPFGIDFELENLELINTGEAIYLTLPEGYSFLNEEKLTDGISYIDVRPHKITLRLNKPTAKIKLHVSGPEYLNSIPVNIESAEGVKLQEFVSNTKKDGDIVNIVFLKEDFFFSDDGYLYLPVRETCEAMGLNVSWNNEERTIIVKNPDNIKDTKVFFTKDAYVCEGTTTYDIRYTGVKPVIKNGKTYLPIQYLRSIFDSEILYFENEKAIKVFR